MEFLQTAVLLTAGVPAAAAVILSHGASRFFSICMWTFAGICAGTAAVCLLLLPLYFRHLQCIVTEAQITVKAGIFFRRESSVRLQTVQFVQIITGPFGGRWGMRFILLHVYGGRLLLPFLGRQDYGELTEFLRAKGVFHAP